MEPKRILVVDDEGGFTRLLKITLEATKKYIVQEENDGSKALATAREFRPDVVLLDVVMPKMDGGDVARQLSSDRLLAGTKIIFLTAIVSQKEESSVAGISGFPFMAKPVSLDALMKMIDSTLGNHSAA